MFAPALLPSAAEYGKLPVKSALGASVMLFSVVPFNVAIPVGVKSGGVLAFVCHTAPTQTANISVLSFIILYSFSQHRTVQTKGRDYSRSISGTGMPLKNAFGTPSLGVLQHRLRSMKFPVSRWTAAEDANFDR
jgi:hypothetical protein